MRSIDAATVPELIELLTGRPNSKSPEIERDGDRILRVKGLGYSQLNELLLLLGQNRITHPFFQFLVDGSASYKSGAAIKSLSALRASVKRFLILAMRAHGNIRYAFDYLATLDEEALTVELRVLDPIPEADFHDRHAPLQSILPIPGTETHYLGYLSGRELDEALNKTPNDKSLLRAKSKRDELIKKGIRNHEAYLASDHMDVYVATSMRERFDFFFVNAFCGKVFSDTRLRKLNLRYFDPTQAYCHD